MNTLPKKKKKKLGLGGVCKTSQKTKKMFVVDTNGLYIFENVAKYKSLMALKILL